MFVTCPKCTTQYQIPDEVHLPLGKKVQCSNCQHIFTMTDIEQQDSPITSSVEEVTPGTEQQNQSTSLPSSSENNTVFADDAVFQEEVPQPFVPMDTKEQKSTRPVGLLTMIVCAFVFVVLITGGFIYRDILFNNQFLRQPKPIENKTTLSFPTKDVPPPQKPSTHYVEETPQMIQLPQIQSVRFEKRNENGEVIRIEGILRNTTNEPLPLPEKVRAVAYNTQGNVLFEKDIYLTDTILPANEERSFFGSYQPAPADIQWIDVTF